MLDGEKGGDEKGRDGKDRDERDGRDGVTGERQGLRDEDWGLRELRGTRAEDGMGRPVVGGW